MKFSWEYLSFHECYNKHKLPYIYSVKSPQQITIFEEIIEIF